MFLSSAIINLQYSVWLLFEFYNGNQFKLLCYIVFRDCMLILNRADDLHVETVRANCMAAATLATVPIIRL